MKFSLSFTWSYDPWGIISKLRVENKTTPYMHTPRLEIEKYVNQSVWAENTFQEAEEQLFSTSNLQTSTPQEKTSKRQREQALLVSVSSSLYQRSKPLVAFHIRCPAQSFSFHQAHKSSDDSGIPPVSLMLSTYWLMFVH